MAKLIEDVEAAAREAQEDNEKMRRQLEDMLNGLATSEEEVWPDSEPCMWQPQGDSILIIETRNSLATSLYGLLQAYIDHGYSLASLT